MGGILHSLLMVPWYTDHLLFRCGKDATREVVGRSLTGRSIFHYVRELLFSLDLAGILSRVPEQSREITYRHFIPARTRLWRPKDNEPTLEEAISEFAQLTYDQLALEPLANREFRAFLHQLHRTHGFPKPHEGRRLHIVDYGEWISERVSRDELSADISMICFNKYHEKCLESRPHFLGLPLLMQMITKYITTALQPQFYDVPLGDLSEIMEIILGDKLALILQQLRSHLAQTDTGNDLQHTTNVNESGDITGGDLIDDDDGDEELDDDAEEAYISIPATCFQRK